MKKSEFYKMATDKAAEYIAQGFWLSDSMSGHQGEEFKVDLTDGEKVIRILVEKTYCSELWGMEKLTLCVRQYDIKNYRYRRTLWNDDGEVIFSIDMYDLARNYNNGSYLVDLEEAERITKIRSSRAKSKRVERKMVKYLDDDIREIALKVIRRQPRCKSRKLEDIICVTRTSEYWYIDYRSAKGTQTYRLR